MGRRLTAWLAAMPSTNARIAVTLLCVFGTAVRYWASSSWVPDGGWLTFLAAMSASDGAVFYLKRRTNDGYNRTQNGNEDSPPSGTAGPLSVPSAP
jgi:hypothetical protein